MGGLRPSSPSYWNTPVVASSYPPVSAWEPEGDQRHLPASAYPEVRTFEETALQDTPVVAGDAEDHRRKVLQLAAGHSLEESD